MRKTWPFLIAMALDVGCLHAQLDLLTLREAESIVELVPGVVSAQKKGECPESSASYEEPEILSFQVRSTCGPTGGMLINNYTVNRRTGEVRLWGDDPQPVADKAGGVFATQLVVQARKRILNASEAGCLALEAARSLPGWSATNANVSIESFGKPEREQMMFSAKCLSSTRSAQSGRMLTVSLAEARVRDDETGLYIASEGLGALTSKILELHSPLRLTDE